MVLNDELIQKLNQITEIATERQKAAEKIIKDHEKWERKFFKRIFKKGIDNIILMWYSKYINIIYKCIIQT